MIRIILVAGIILVYTFVCLKHTVAQEILLIGKKEVPVITFKNLSPPFKDYDYFQGIKKYDFQYKATSFNLINAWWLAEISTLVYADEEFVRPRLKNAGLPKIKFFDKLSTQCYVASNDRFAIIAFRGSEIWKKKEKFNLQKVIADFKADVDIRLIDWQQGGKVHRGFKEALDEVLPELLPYIRNLENKGLKIWITGHSLGGALATLCGALLGNAQGVYTFGSPSVGDEDFKEHLSIKGYRIVNNDDFVSWAPSLFVYVHVGEPKFINSDGIIGDTVVEYERPVDQLCDETYGEVDSSQPKKTSFKGFIPAPFRDHVPLLYAIHLWNNLIESQK